MEHYYTPKPTSELRTKQVEFSVRGVQLKCDTASSVFATSGLDVGTKALLELCILQKDWRVLDLGCGWGSVGLVCAKLGCIVTLTDVNERAVMFAKINLRKNKLKGSVVRGNLYEKVDGFFDSILLNPPQTAGRDICYQMIEQAPKYLVTGGLFQFVARHNKGGAMLQKKIEEVFGNSTALGRAYGFTVYMAKKMG